MARRKELLALYGSLCLFLSSFLSSIPADARTWSRDRYSLAADYSVVIDMRSPTEQVLVVWLNSAMVPPGPSAPAAIDFLDRYVFVAVAHAHVNKDAALSFTSIPTLTATDRNGKALKLLDDSDLPPNAVGVRAMLQSMFARILGPYGAGIRWFAFDSSAVRACGKGGLRIPVDGDTYSFDTPVPGCH